MGSGIDDTILVTWARQGHREAFDELSRRHYRVLYRVALRTLRDVSDAEDATQEAFERAWLALPHFESRAAFGTWMYRIISNICRKKQQQQHHALSLDAARQTPETHEPGPEQLVECADRDRALRSAIAALPPAQRSPLVLREYGDCSYEEISRRLGISTAAVRGRLHRARVELMKTMNPWI